MAKDYPVVVIQNTKTKQLMTVGQAEYASDLGQERYKGWRIKTERRGRKKLEATEDASTLGIPSKISKEEMDTISKPKTEDQKVKPKEKEELPGLAEEITPEEKGFEA